jgi:hypothetical protein
MRGVCPCAESRGSRISVDLRARAGPPPRGRPPEADEDGQSKGQAKYALRLGAPLYRKVFTTELRVSRCLAPARASRLLARRTQVRGLGPSIGRERVRAQVRPAWVVVRPGRRSSPRTRSWKGSVWVGAAGLVPERTISPGPQLPVAGVHGASQVPDDSSDPGQAPPSLVCRTGPRRASTCSFL